MEASPLTGKALLEKIKELGHLSKRETAIQCGYSTVSKAGVTRADITSLYDAVLEAKGVVIGQAASNEVKRGKSATYIATVQKGGQITIGAAYVKEMKAEVGSNFIIKIGAKGLRLVPASESLMTEEVSEDLLAA